MEINKISFRRQKCKKKFLFTNVFFIFLLFKTIIFGTKSNSSLVVWYFFIEFHFLSTTFHVFLWSSKFRRRFCLQSTWISFFQRFSCRLNWGLFTLFFIFFILLLSFAFSWLFLWQWSLVSIFWGFWKSSFLAFALIFLLLSLLLFKGSILLSIFLERSLSFNNRYFFRLLFCFLNLSLWFAFTLDQFCLFWFSFYFLGLAFKKLRFFILGAILSNIWSEISLTCLNLFSRSLHSFHYCFIDFIFLHLFLFLAHFSRLFIFQRGSLTLICFWLFFIHLSRSNLMLRLVSHNNRLNRLNLLSIFFDWLMMRIFWLRFWRGFSFSWIWERLTLRLFVCFFLLRLRFILYRKR